MKNWGCRLEDIDAWFAQFTQDSVLEFLEVLGSTALRKLKLHFEVHGERLAPTLFERMAACCENETPFLPNLETLIIEDTALGFAPDVITQMLASRWDIETGDAYPLRECVIHTRGGKREGWAVTEVHGAALKACRERGFTVEFGVSTKASRRDMASSVTGSEWDEDEASEGEDSEEDAREEMDEEDV